MTSLFAEVHVSGVLRRREPMTRGTPLVIAIPRSRDEHTREFRSPAPFNDVKSSISMYVEELFAKAAVAGRASSLPVSQMPSSTPIITKRIPTSL